MVEIEKGGQDGRLLPKGDYERKRTRDGGAAVLSQLRAQDYGVQRGGRGSPDGMPEVSGRLVQQAERGERDRHQNESGGLMGIVMLLLAGFVAAIALVLPGISVSYMLLMLGMYSRTMEALSGFQISYLAPLGIGLILGILATTKLLDKLMSRFPQGTYLVILGFIIGSVLQVFPGIPQGWELLFCPVLFAAGFFAMYRLSLLESR